MGDAASLSGVVRQEPPTCTTNWSSADEGRVARVIQALRPAVVNEHQSEEQGGGGLGDQDDRVDVEELSGVREVALKIDS